MTSLPSPSSSPYLPVTAAPLPSPSSNTNNTTLTVAAVTLASLLAAAFLFLTYYAVLLRHRPPPHPSPPLSPPSPPHHAWLIRTVGLDDSLIRSIPAVPFSSSDPPTDCAVCLSDLSHGDLVRFLPLCHHAFHVPCVDTWLRSHVSCPLCRSPVLLHRDADPDLESASESCLDGNREGATTDRSSQPVGPSASMDSRASVIVVETRPSKESSSEAVDGGRKEEEEEEEGDETREVESPQSSSGGGFFSRLRNGRSGSRSSSSVLPF